LLCSFGFGLRRSRKLSAGQPQSISANLPTSATEQIVHNAAVAVLEIWMRNVWAFAWGALVGILGGLIGLGGAEFRYLC